MTFFRVNSRKGILRDSENGSFELNDLDIDEQHSPEAAIPDANHMRRRVSGVLGLSRPYLKIRLDRLPCLFGNRHDFVEWGERNREYPSIAVAY